MIDILLSALLLAGCAAVVIGLYNMIRYSRQFAQEQFVADLEKLLAEQMADRERNEQAIIQTTKKLMLALEMLDHHNKTRADAQRAAVDRARAAAQARPQPAEGRNITGRPAQAYPFGESSPPARGGFVSEQPGQRIAPAGSNVRAAS